MCRSERMFGLRVKVARTFMKGTFTMENRVFASSVEEELQTFSAKCQQSPLAC